jgi:hypothetical protein
MSASLSNPGFTPAMSRLRALGYGVQGFGSRVKGKSKFLHQILFGLVRNTLRDPSVRFCAALTIRAQYLLCSMWPSCCTSVCRASLLLSYTLVSLRYLGTSTPSGLKSRQLRTPST